MTPPHPLRAAAALAVTAVALNAVGLGPTATADTAAPPCPQVVGVISPASLRQHPDCRMHSGDPSGLNFDVSYWSAEPKGTPRAAKVLVTDAAGAQVQIINELLEPSSPAGVGLEDLDGDGRTELLIPIAENSFNGAPNTRFSVWRAEGDSVHFERTQMVGQAVYPSGDGYIVTNGGALTSRDLTFYLPTSAGYTLVVSLTIAAEQVEPGTGRVLTVSCDAHQQQGLQLVEMDVAHARDAFCVSPAARAIWPNAQRL